MPESLPIRARLLLYYALSLFLLIAVSSVALLAVVSLDRITTAFDQKWVAGTRILGEMADLLTEIRLGETWLARATTPEEERRAIDYTDDHIRDLSEQRALYDRLEKRDQEQALLETFDRAWSRWATAHRAWAALPRQQRLSYTSAFDTEANELYRKADDAIDALGGANADGAAAAGHEADRISDRTALTLYAAVVLALLVAGWLAIMIRNQISRPLASITSALTDLAAGDRDRVIPEIRRRDEIGKLAQAFDVFRANAFALDKAHKAAEEAQAQAQALARHDPLTGLTNRRVLSESLDRAFARARRFGRNFAVLLIDLDRFKPINDIHGHLAGDVVLCEIANRLQQTVRQSDTVSRIGGDEFAIVCDLEASSMQTSEEVILFAERVLTAVRATMQAAHASVEVDASIGIAFGPGDGADAEAILRAADIAMYRAKSAGGGTFRFFEQSMDDELKARAEIETDVRHAVVGGEIEPYYQPLVELATGKLVGFEMLARWHHPRKGNVPPAEFIPIIEHLGLIADFTWNILRRACLEAKAWPEDLRLSVNISPVQLTDMTFPARLLRVLEDTGFSPRRLEIEITETALLSDLATVKAVLASLQGLGITVAIDDFGTGYSSLYHLRELKLDKIKIDRSFILSMNQNPESAKIVNAILGLARNLSLPTTAEGIEDADALAVMNEAGCEIGQGYYFGKAMTANEAAALATGDRLVLEEERRIA